MNTINQTLALREALPRGFYTIYQWYCSQKGITPLTKNQIHYALYHNIDKYNIIPLLKEIFDGKDLSHGNIKITGHRNTKPDVLQSYRNRVKELTRKRKPKYLIYCYLTPKEERYSCDVFRKAINGYMYCEKILEYLEKHQ